MCGINAARVTDVTPLLPEERGVRARVDRLDPAPVVHHSPTPITSVSAE